MEWHRAAILFAANVASALAVPALAEEALRPNERYCLEAPDVDVPLCRFSTLEQCMQSRTSHADSCALNPILAFRARR